MEKDKTKMESTGKNENTAHIEKHPEDKEHNCHCHNHDQGSYGEEKCAGDNCCKNESGCEEGVKQTNPTNSEKTVEQLEQQVRDLTDLLQRTQANFENYRKQIEKRTQDLQKLASRDIIEELLPVVDNFDLALKAVDSQANNTKDKNSSNKNDGVNTATVDNKEFLQGIKMIHSQLQALLEKNKITVIATEKKKFDPYLHEAYMRVESDQPENTILEELQKGYYLNGMVIRHAKVKISTGKK